MPQGNEIPFRAEEEEVVEKGSLFILLDAVLYRDKYDCSC